MSNYSNVRESERITDERFKILRQSLVKKEIERNQFEEQVDKEIAQIAIAKLPNANVLDELNLHVDDDAEWGQNRLEHVNSFTCDENFLKKQDSVDHVFPETKKKDIMFDS